MTWRWPIRTLLIAILAGAGGCATTPPDAVPIGQQALDEFLAPARDARVLGITTYQDAAGPRFESANRLHLGQAAQLDFISPRNLPMPVIRAQTGMKVEFPLLLDSSARQSWLLLESVPAMEYRPFAPPAGEYPDHVVSDIPGYVGAGNTLILDLLHIEYPIFYVPPARGRLGPLARIESGGRQTAARRALAGRLPAVMGAALMRSFAFIRFDFPNRTVCFSSDTPYRPAAPEAVYARLPLLDWRGRPAVEGLLNGKPVTLILDTAGDFDLSCPGRHSADQTGKLVLGDWPVDDVKLTAHAALGLPEDFPVRLGLGVLSRSAVTFDFRNRTVWFEGKPLPGGKKSATNPGDDTPIQYRGITR